jgi:hypothetical protein
MMMIMIIIIIITILDSSGGIVNRLLAGRSGVPSKDKIKAFLYSPNRPDHP